jgi:hypothetical protein
MVGIRVSNRDAYRNALTYALGMSGSEVELANLLKVSVPQLRKWLDGSEEIPGHIFLLLNKLEQKP